MKRVALGLAVIGAVCFAANQSSAQGVLSHATAIQVAAGHGIYNTAAIGSTHHIQQVGLYGPGYYGPRIYRGYGPALAYPPVWRRPPVVIPVPAYPSVVPLPIYRGPAYYYGPQYGFSYRSPSFSFGFSF
jgi:hypothetical protein